MSLRKASVMQAMRLQIIIPIKRWFTGGSSPSRAVSCCSSRWTSRVPPEEDVGDGRPAPPGPRPTQRTDNCGRSMTSHMTSQLKRPMLDRLCSNPRPGSKPSVVDRLA